MTYSSATACLILSVSPSSRGFGFVLFRGPSRLIDWGVKEARTDKNARCLAKLSELIEFYEPEVIVLENYTEDTSRRCQRIRTLMSDVTKLAAGKNITVCAFSRGDLETSFSQFGASTKYQRAKLTVAQFPELAPRLPPPRKPWMSEDPRMSIFEAAALAVMYWYGRGEKAHVAKSAGSLST